MNRPPSSSPPTSCRAETLKAEGNSRFQKGDLDGAIASYQSSLEAIRGGSSSSEGGATPLLLPPTVLSNLALCRLKRHEAAAAAASKQKSSEEDEHERDDDDEHDDLDGCVQSCTEALSCLDSLPAPDGDDDADDDSADRRTKLRSKVLYRRARAYAALASSAAHQDHDDDSQRRHLNSAARDLLDVLNIDPHNREAAALLTAVRERHGRSRDDGGSDMARALSHLKESSSAAAGGRAEAATTEGEEAEEVDRNLRVIMGLLTRDVASASMELGRRGGAPILLGVATGGDRRRVGGGGKEEGNNGSDGTMTAQAVLALHALSAACSHGPFVRTYGCPRYLPQEELAHLVSESTCTASSGAAAMTEGQRQRQRQYDVAVAAIALLLRLVVHLDHTAEKMDGSVRGDVDGPSVCRSIVSGLSAGEEGEGEGERRGGGEGSGSGRRSDAVVLQRACLDLLSAWTASDADAVAAAAEAADVYHPDSIASSSSSAGSKTAKVDPHQMKPRDFAAHQKRQYEIHRLNVERGRANAALFCDVETGGLDALLGCAVRTDDHVLRREIGAVIGRLVASFGQDDGGGGDGKDAEDGESGRAVKELVRPVLGCACGTGDGGWDGEEIEEEKGLTIEEIHDDDDGGGEVGEESGAVSTASAPAANGGVGGGQSLDLIMRRGQLTASLLLGNADVGAWALKDAFGLTNLEALISSGNSRAMSIASEVVSAAASTEKGRPLLTPLVERGALEELLMSDDVEVRSGAASAMAKLGLANKDLSSDDGEVIGLLQVAAELIEGGAAAVEEGGAAASNASSLLEKAKKVRPRGAATSSSSTTSVSTAVDRGVEVLSYLSSKTVVKDEIAHGFRAPSSSGGSSILGRLVELGSRPEAGESTSAYGIAAVFALLAVSNETLRREAFAASEMTPEQYDTLQDMGKTEEEKELDKKRADHDPKEAVGARIRSMANADVPRAMVKLMEGSTESTREQLVLGMNRMAVEESVRGVMVQQGCLSACLKVEKGDEPSEMEKKTWQQARHCVAKLLVTMNPSLLTVSQRMGSIGPLIQLIHDNETTDLARFEALLAITNLASIDQETKNRIVAEKGIARLGYAMFSDHEMVRRAATEAMSNLVPHPKMMEHLADPDKLRLWVAFARDFEENFECSRAAIGCLAMATQDQKIAIELANASHFDEMARSLLECGNLELMHRMLVALLNILEAGDEGRDAAVGTGAGAFCEAYVESYQDGKMAGELGMSEADKGLMAVTVELAKEVASKCAYR